jgi:hypothetical protein
MKISTCGLYQLYYLALSFNCRVSSTIAGKKALCIIHKCFLGGIFEDTGDLC